MDNSENVNLLLVIQSDHSLDLSGQVAFKITIEVTRKGYINHNRPITLLKAGSIFDQSAIQNRKILIKDVDSGNLVEQQKPEKSSEVSDECHNDAENALITLAPVREGKSKSVSTFEYTVPISKLNSERSPFGLKAGRWYILEIPEGDCGITWWNYGERSELPEPGKQLPPTEAGKLCASRTCRTRFLAAADLPLPPSISISFSLSSSTISLSGTPPVTLKIIIINISDRPYTFQSVTNDRPPRNILHQDFQLNCFTLINPLTREPASISNPFIQSPPGQGHPRSHFITLVPDEPLVYEHVLTTRHNSPLAGDIAPTMKGQEFVMRLEPKDIWWTEKSIDQLFAGQNRVHKLDYVPPAKLASANEVVFKVVD